MISESWKNYCNQLEKVVINVNTEILSKAIELLRNHAGGSGTIWVVGNGGSAATASHFCVDLSKGCAIRINKSIRAVPLMDLVPIQSAWSNDNSYAVALEMSIRNLARKGDILFAISGSGQSINILNALLAAKDLAIETIGLTGFNGGKMSSLVDIEINVRSEDMQIIEDAHHAICHFISREI